MRFSSMILTTLALSCAATHVQAEGFDSRQIYDDAKQALEGVQFSAGIGYLDFQAEANDQGGRANADSAVYFYGIAERELDIEFGDVKNAAQFRLGTSMNTAVSSNGSKVADASMSYMLSGLWKARLRAADQMSVYGLGGLSFGRSSMDLSAGGSSSSSNFGLTYGVGLDYDVDDFLQVGAEYSFYHIQDGGPAPLTLFAINARLNF